MHLELFLSWQTTFSPIV